MEAGSAVYPIVTEDSRLGDLSHLEASLLKEGFKVEPPMNILTILK